MNKGECQGCLDLWHKNPGCFTHVPKTEALLCFLFIS